MQGKSSFWRYAFSFGVIVIASLLALSLTGYLVGENAPETSCITSSGDPC